MKNLLICLLAAALTASLWVLWRPEPEQPAPAPRQRIERPGPTLPFGTILDEARATAGMEGAAIGFCLIDAAGEVVFEDHARTAFIPASSLKTVVTATALEQLGPDYRFETQLLGTARTDGDGTLTGDLVLRGGADPTLSLQDLSTIAARLAGGGLKRVTGRIIGDGRLLEANVFDNFWEWGDIGNGYGSAVSGLNLEHNRFRARLRGSGQPGEAARLEQVSPEIPAVKLENHTIVGPAGSGDGVTIYGGQFAQRVVFRGTVPPSGRSIEVTGAVPDPERFAAEHLRRALIEKGIVIDGEISTVGDLLAAGQAVPDAPFKMHVHQSDALITIVETIHGRSDNHETECLHRLLGVKAGKAPEQVIREHWAGRGLTFEGLRMEDGCGLARADFIRPIDLTRLQHLMGNGEQGQVYKDSLLGSPERDIIWKAGAMSSVRTYTGYVRSKAGEQFCFTLMMNHYSDGSAVSELRDQIVDAMLAL